MSNREHKEAIRAAIEQKGYSPEDARLLERKAANAIFYEGVSKIPNDVYWAAYEEYQRLGVIPY